MLTQAGSVAVIPASASRLWRRIRNVFCLQMKVAKAITNKAQVCLMQTEPHLSLLRRPMSGSVGAQCKI